MWEDLGADAVTALADIQDGYYATGEEMENLNDIKYDDLGAQFEQLKSNVETAIIPIGEALIPLLSQLAEAVLPLLSNVLAPLLEQVAAFLTYPGLDSSGAGAFGGCVCGAYQRGHHAVGQCAGVDSSSGF